MQGGITLTDLHVAVPGRAILHGITATLTEARIGIVGRNGSGKTTLLRAMAGLVAPASGTVTVEGADPADRRAMLSRIGILFQNPDHQILFPTVEEELAFGLRQIGLSKADASARVRATLAAANRADWADRPTAGLSQGQKQYLCLLAVLLMGPQTILLDEPFAALDLPTRLRLERHLATLPQRLITITHDPDATIAADRVLWIEEGRLKACGPPAEVLPAFRAEMARLGAEDF